MKKIKEIFKTQKIEYLSALPFSECKIINEAKLKRSFGDAMPKTAIVFLVPYYIKATGERNISRYAVAKDYHQYCKDLFYALTEKLSSLYPQNTFVGFADSSPIAEVDAAARAGLGVIGKKGQLINEKYGSYTFIAELITDYIPSEYSLYEIKTCISCGACERVCPAQGGACLSELTQRKGELTDPEKHLLAENGSVWGCDICREVCPMNKTAEETPIDFFKKDLISFLTEETVDGMSREEFESRAYSWRGKKTVLRNLQIIKDCKT